MGNPPLGYPGNPGGIPRVPWIYIPGKVPPGYPWIPTREIPHEDPPDSPWGTSRVPPQSTPPPPLGGWPRAPPGVVVYKSQARRWSPQQTRQANQMKRWTMVPLRPRLSLAPRPVL